MTKSDTVSNIQIRAQRPIQYVRTSFLCFLELSRQEKRIPGMLHFAEGRFSEMPDFFRCRG